MRLRSSEVLRLSMRGRITLITLKRSDLITLLPYSNSVCKFKDFLQFRCAKVKKFENFSYILHSFFGLTLSQ